MFLPIVNEKIILIFVKMIKTLLSSIVNRCQDYYKGDVLDLNHEYNKDSWRCTVNEQSERSQWMEN